MVFVPVIVYFAVAESVAVILHFLNDSGITALNGTASQLIQTVAAFPVVYFAFYRPGRARFKKWHETQWAGDFPGKINATDMIISVVIMLTGSYAGNNIAELINLTSYSGSYGEIEASFYSGTLPLELITFVIVSPVAEEILYRGVVFFDIKRVLGVWPAIIVSTVMFSIFHMNLVQIVYALFMGFYLGLIMERSENIFVPVAGHAAANALSVIRAETGFLSVTTIGYDMYVITAILCFAVSVVLAVFLSINLGKRLNIVEK